MRRISSAALLAVASAVLLAACGSSDGGSSTAKTATTTTAAAKPKAAGTVRVLYATPGTDAQKLAKTLLTAGGTTQVAVALGKDFTLPYNVKVLVRDTSDAGPYFNPDDHSINLDYDFASFVLNTVKKNNPKITDYNLGKSVAAINSFIFVHEFAHLLINAYDLPITGKEEDAADQLATVFMVDFVKGGADYAYDAADFFASLAQNPSALKQADFFDEHSLNEQRAYSIACWIAGGNEDYYKALKKNGVLSPERLAQCPDEYARIDHAWRTLIKPHLATSAKLSDGSTT